MILYAFTGTLTDVNGEMNWFMPGLTEGTFFSGTMALEPDTSSPSISSAVLHLTADAQLVNARSVGLDPGSSDCRSGKNYQEESTNVSIVSVCVEQVRRTPDRWH